MKIKIKMKIIKKKNCPRGKSFSQDNNNADYMLINDQMLEIKTTI